MTDLNNIIIIGRLTRDPELKQTDNSMVCNFSIANNNTYKGEDKVSYIDVACWGKTAEIVAQYLFKGSQVAISGRLEQQRWEKEGEKKSKIVIQANSVQFLGKKESDNPFAGSPV